MKKRLLKPPQNDAELFVSPSISTLLTFLGADKTICTAHQPYFFNPGVSVKFLFLNALAPNNKKILFLDTDRVHISVLVPHEAGSSYPIEFIRSEKILCDCPAPSKETCETFFSSLKSTIKKNIPSYASGINKNIGLFQELLLSKKYTYLKEMLAESFLSFYGMQKEYGFVSSLVRSKEFEDFFARIWSDDTAYRDVFNNALDEYRKEYRFRYKNFPFPKLEDGELPFWVIKSQQRYRCFKKDISNTDVRNIGVFPRASTLTIFLRLYACDIFLHGIGGANYEWVGDRVVERFFKKDPPLWGVVSGTFLVGMFKERELPYFFFDPQMIKDKIEEVIKGGIYA
ncbi:MAG: hypothetical protein JSW40_06985 [Candidatus Omnitrophota bacterium]|nr:MAG: hypothetical protein JSW40_06985 [Candidatus Omnitrophota bacterium]